MLSGRPLDGTPRDLDLFVGRDDLLDRIQDSVERRLNTLVAGERRAGKTSLLHVLERRLEPRFHTVFIDGGMARDATAFLSLLLYALERERALAGGNVNVDLVRPLVPLPLPEAQADRVLAVLDAIRLAVERWGRGVVVIVDDMRSPELSHFLFGRMRDELWMLGATWVVAVDSQDKATALRPPADAFFETIVDVTPLDRDASADLLTRRLNEEEADPAFIHRLADVGEGSPGRLIELAREVIVHGMPIGEATSRRAAMRLRATAIGDSARRLVEDLLAYGPTSASDESLLRRLNWSRARATQVFKQLEGEGLVRPLPSRGGGGRKVYELDLNDET